jgi:hypothetical protein
MTARAQADLAGVWDRLDRHVASKDAQALIHSIQFFSELRRSRALGSASHPRTRLKFGQAAVEIGPVISRRAYPRIGQFEA